MTDNIGFINVFRTVALFNLIVFPLLLIGVFKTAPEPEAITIE